MSITLNHDHTALRVVDFDGTLAWYRDKLDFTLDRQWPFADMQMAFISHGDVRIEVLGGSTAEPQEDVQSLESTFRREGVHHLCLAVSDLEDTLEELGARGVGVVGEPFVVAEVSRRVAFIKDNSENLIELSAPIVAERTDNPHDRIV